MPCKQHYLRGVLGLVLWAVHIEYFLSVWVSCCLQGGGRLGRRLMGSQVQLPHLSGLSVPAATGSKPRVSTAFSEEATHTSSQEKLGCYLPKRREFSDAVCAASSRLRLDHHKRPPARAAPPGLHWVSLWLTPSCTGWLPQDHQHCREHTAPTGGQPGHRTSTHSTCWSPENQSTIQAIV